MRLVIGPGRSIASVALTIALGWGGVMEPASAERAAFFVVAQAEPSEELDAVLAEGNRLFQEGSVEALKQAIAQLERAVQLSQAANVQDKQAFALLLLGRINDLLGEKQQALSFYEQALPLYQALGDRSGKAVTLSNIGRVYSDLGEKEKALEFYSQALPLRRAVGDRSGEAGTLNNIGHVYDDLGEKEKALEFYNQALPLWRAVGDGSGKAVTLNNIGRVYSDLGEKEKALEFYNQALPLRRAVGDRSGEAKTLNNIGAVYSDLGEKEKALEFLNQALPLSRAVGDRSGEAGTLNNIGRVYDDLGEKEKALEFLNQALPLRRAVGDRSGEATTLNNIGRVYDDLGEKEKALEFYNQALPLSRAMGDRSGEAGTLNNIGRVYDDLGEKEKALEFYNQALPLSRAVGDRSGEAGILSNIGIIHNAFGEKEKALEFYNQALPLSRAVGDRSGEATTLNNIGRVYSDLGEKEKALEFYNQALPLLRAVGDRSGEAVTLNNIGRVYDDLGEKEEALEFYNQALPLSRAVGYRSGEAGILSNIGLVYSVLGEEEKALEFYNQALPLRRAVGDRSGEAATLNNIGRVYDDLGEKEKALEFYNQALPLRRAVGDRSGEAATLNNIGHVYDDLGEKEKALDLYNQALPLVRAVGDRSGEAGTLNNIGHVYDDLGEKEKALDLYNQALPLWRAVGDRSGEAIILNNIAFTLIAERPTAAISFFKQSVNLFESLRQDIKTLPQEIRETYAESISGTYRALADALLSQGRIGEAQQVLELLRVQEATTYTRSTTAEAELALSDSEKEILASHDTLIAFGQTLRTCQRNPACKESGELTKLNQQLIQQINAFESLVQTFQAQFDVRKEKDKAFIDPNDPNKDLRRRAEELLQAQPGSLLIYPLVLEDKMWLLIVGDGPVPTRHEVDVSQKELAETIIAFRTEMKRCETGPCTAADTARAQAISQKLHNWLLPEALQEAMANAPNPITNLIFAPDRSTRYIPMGALHDGKGYLAESYTISTIVAASETNATEGLPQGPQVLGMGLSQPVTLSEPTLSFGSLPSVPLEVNAIVSTEDPDPGIFSGNVFLDDAFTQERLQNNLDGHDILHLATHGKFEPGDIDQSFLLLGGGEDKKFPIQQINNLNGLPNVHLVVLSACETALGDRREEDGTEIAGISNAFLQRGAKAVVASLWQVNDPATGAYMQRFYKNLEKPGTTKVRAMQQVRQDFIDGRVKLEDLDSFRAGLQVVANLSETSGEIDLSHPYYWSAFILIGNGL